MKKWIYMMAAAATMAACSNEELPSNEVNNSDEVQQVTVTATLPGNDSRVSLEEVEDNGKKIIKVEWNESNETFSVMTTTPLSVSDENDDSKHIFNQIEGDNFNGTLPEAVTGEPYYAFYPGLDMIRMVEGGEYIWQDGDGPLTSLAATKVPFNLSFQGNGDLSASNTLMYATSEDGTSFDFHHLTAIVKFTLHGLSKDGMNGWNFYIDWDGCGTSGLLDLTKDNVAEMYPQNSNSSEHDITVGATIEDGSSTFYAYLPPVAQGKTLNISCVFYKSDGDDYYEYKYTTSVELNEKAIEAGKFYRVERTMEEVLPMGNKTAEQAVKGDLAMADGTFISKDEINNLTDEQKANVRGIVFWTESESGNATLTSDAIMTDEHPNCTHGLIVALKNVSESCLWQSGYESVANWQNDEFNADNTSDYKSIASQRNNDDCIKYILGYQNTKVLKAYNESLSSDESDKTVLPVSELATWEENNPAPANTTGWFIPSVKELHMLCYKDVNDLLIYNTSNTTTRTVIDPLIEALGGKKLSDYYYWSSSEDADNAYNAFNVYFKYGSVNYYFKSGNTAYVRAVCAF